MRRRRIPPAERKAISHAVLEVAPGAEHAFLLDYKPSERSRYVDAFFQNLDWSVVEQRFRSPAAARSTG